MHYQRTLKYILFVLLVVVLSVKAIPVKAVVTDQDITFKIDSGFDVSGRAEVSTTLIKTTQSLYFYVEKSWWDAQPPAKKSQVFVELDALSSEFDNKIYPTLTSVFGSEWKPGVDGDNKITIVFHSMKDGAGGYFRSTDEYLKLQVPDSNEREMIYLSLANIDNPQLKVLLGHEFVHMITFNQKDRVQGVQEEIWLNEARADFASTILGYDDNYEGSNLQRRVKDFLEKPSDALTEWQETKYDYAVDNIFIHYLVDHYSVSVLSDSLKSKQVGIASINEALMKKGFKEDFSQAFTNWTIATIINDCSVNNNYCYLSQALKNLRINPTINFLPLTGNSSLSVTNTVKNWAGNWQKFIGGNGDLHLDFSSLPGLTFQIPYLIFDKANKSTLKFLTLDKNQKGQIDIKNFGDQYNSLIIIPSLQNKFSHFDSPESTYPYTFKVNLGGVVVIDDNQALITQLLAQIEALKKQIADIQAQQNGQHSSSCTITSNLSVGVSNSSEVSCLQQFLKSQGVYPEGYVTGTFGSLTKAAVIRFQEKYALDILIPVGLAKGTGYVGLLTRIKINALNK